MANSIVNHDFSGLAIPQRETDGFVSLTRMAKAYPSKRMSDFLKSNSTNAYLVALSSKTGISVLDLVTAQQGGNHSGTWAHPEVAIKFAAWLSPEFEVWAMHTLFEIITGKNAPTIDPAEKWQLKHLADLIREANRAGLTTDSDVRVKLKACLLETLPGDIEAAKHPEDIEAAKHPEVSEALEADCLVLQRYLSKHKKGRTLRQMQNSNVLRRRGTKTANGYRERLAYAINADKIDYDEITKVYTLTNVK